MHDGQAKNDLYDGIARVGKAIASGRRLEIVDLLTQGPLVVDAIARQLHLSVANASQHLQILTAAGLVTARRRGREVEYRIGPCAASLVDVVRRIALEQIDDVERLVTGYLGTQDDIEWITRAELRRRLRRGAVVVVDVRPRSEFGTGHVAGAISIPLDELAARIDELPDAAEVVAYCRGPFCAMADTAVRLLRDRGLHALRLEDGYPEWAREVGA